MTRDEILSKYRVIAVAPPKKGQLFLCGSWFTTNPSENYQVVRCKRTFKRICCEILVEKGDNE